MSDARTPSSFVELMNLDHVAEGFFVGHTPDYPWGRVFGGQVVAQALRAAAATVEAPHRVHSLHAYFVLGGRPNQPILYEVDRLREGRSFTTRRVVARQSDGAILNLDASFQRDEIDVDIQESTGADAPSPLSVPLTEWPLFGEVREVPHEPGIPRSRVWMRVADELDADPVLHACALAYLSDHNPMDAIVLSHPKGLDWDQLMTASLDHAIWFHRPARADDWMMFDMSGHGLVNARGMATGTVHSVEAVHLATVAQEGLVRSPRTAEGTS
jgi:acyl-CoA thioesterase-2